MSKNAHFSHFFFLGNKGNENVFYDIQEQENVFLGYKNKRFKQWKIDLFPKGLTHAFGQKMPVFQFFFLGNFSQESVFYDILEQKNAFQGYKNKKFQKSKNWHSSKKVNAWFWSKNGHFSNFFFLSNIGQENVFYDILQRKNAFLGFKNKKFKQSKNWHFLKGLTDGFGPKMGIFPTFFF